MHIVVYFQGCALRHSCSRSRSSGNSSNRNAQFNKSHFSPSHRRGDSPFSPSSGARCWLRRREGNRLWDTSHRRPEWRGTFLRFRHAQLPDRLYRHGHFTGGHPQYDRLVIFVNRLFKWLIGLFVDSRETPERNTSPLPSFLPSSLYLSFFPHHSQRYIDNILPGWLPNTWIKHSGANCYGDRDGHGAHGASDLENPPSSAAPGSPMTLAACE
jgi:hypothetical protein